MVGYGLMDLAILVALGLGMADEDDELYLVSKHPKDVDSYEAHTLGLPMMVGLRP